MMTWQRLSWIPFAAFFVLIVGCSGGGRGGLGADDDSLSGSDSIADSRLTVEAGNFIRGIDESNFPSANPSSTIYISEFEISTTEVTNEQYCEFLNDGNSRYFDTEMMIGYSTATHLYAPVTGYEDHPVVNVTWYDAASYALWAGGRLPTEAEWEKAARGTDGYYFPWGNDFLNDRADVGRSDESETIDVKSYPDGVSPYGVYDMAGSVWEWTNDWYYLNYYEYSETEDPTGPTDSTTYTSKVIRGGGFRETEANYHTFMTWYRYYGNPASRADDLGFRVVWPDTSSSE